MNYNLIALAFALLLAAALSLTVTADPLPDSDGDTVPDIHDNCLVKPNVDQYDEDRDGYGNVCDADYSQDGKVHTGSLIFFMACFSTYDAECDHNCDGKINTTDFITFKELLPQPFVGTSGQSRAQFMDDACPQPPPARDRPVRFLER